MTIERIIELLSKHISLQSADYALAMARVDIPTALAIEAGLIQSRNTLALLQTLLQPPVVTE